VYKKILEMSLKETATILSVSRRFLSRSSSFQVSWPAGASAPSAQQQDWWMMVTSAKSHQLLPTSRVADHGKPQWTFSDWWLPVRGLSDFKKVMFHHWKNGMGIGTLCAAIGT